MPKTRPGPGVPRNLTAALRYASVGWPVLPCHSSIASTGGNRRCTCQRPDCPSPGKHPITTHGLKDATTDHTTIERWWGERPWANIAVLTGQPSGLVVLDVDPRNGGLESLQALKVPDTLAADTGGAGKHYYFSNTDPCPGRKLAPGLDLKADGGYVIVPPSTHVSGRDYRWPKGAGPVVNGSGKPMTPLTLLGLPDPPPAAPVAPEALGERVYPQGTRHRNLCSIIGAMNRRGMAIEAIRSAARAENEAKCRPPKSEHEVDRLVDSITGLYTPAAPLGEPELNPTAGPIVSELLPAILARPTQETPWAVHGFLAEDDIALIDGPGGVGKTWLMMAIGIALATGRKLLDHYDVIRPYRIAFLDLESRPWEVDQRFQRLAKGVKISPEHANNIRVIRERITFGRDPSHTAARLIEHLREWRTEFLLIDSFRRLHCGEENDSGVISGLFQGVFDRIRRELGTATLIVDHTRKLAGDPLLDDPAEQTRGSGDKRNMVDAHFAVRERDEALVLIPTKTRHSIKPHAINFRLSGLHDEGESGPVKVTFGGLASKASSEQQDEILAIIKAHGPINRKDLLLKSKFSGRTLDRVLWGLKRQGLIVGKQEGMCKLYKAR